MRWLLKANDVDYGEARAECAGGLAPAPHVWTAPAKVRPGDLVVLYGLDPVKSFGLVGVFLTEAEKGQDGRYWAEIQWAAAGEVTLSEVRDDLAFSGWPASLAGSHQELSDDRIWAALRDRLLGGASDTVRGQVARWEQGVVPEPSGADLAASSFPGLAEPGLSLPETEMQKRLRRHLIRRFKARPLKPKDGVEVPESNYLGRDVGYPDLVLVQRWKRRTLLLIEVKKVPQQGETRDGITQLERYAPKLQAQAPGWTVRKILAAVRVPEVIRTRAAKKNVDCWEFDPRRGRIK